MKKILILVLSFYTIGFSQSNIVKSDSANFGDKLWSDIKLSFDDNINYFSRPAKFNSTDWIKLAGVTAVTGLLTTVDKEVRNSVQKNQSRQLDNFTKIGNYYGGFYPVALSAVAYGGGLIFRNHELRTTGRILIESLVAAGITTTALKVIIGRNRPFTNNGEYKFNFFSIKNESNSLPSGHATVAFTISTVLAKRIDNTYASILLYGLASFTAYQRIYSDNHWLSDTFLGAAIGYTAGSYFSNLEEERNSENKSNFSYQIMPNINSNGIGFSFLLQF